MLKKILALLAMLYAAASFAAVDVNKATAAELDGLKGIGPGISSKIVEERKKGAFKDWNDFIDRVKGVGEVNAAKFSSEGLTVNGTSFTGAAAVPAKKADSKPVAAKDSKDAKPAAKADEKKADSKPAAAADAPAPAAPVAAADKADAKAQAKAQKEADKKAKAEAKAKAAEDKKAKAAEAKAAKAAKKEEKKAEKAAAKDDKKPADGKK